MGHEKPNTSFGGSFVISTL